MMDQTARTLCLFSHPNHEIAVYGLIVRMRPSIVYLTDGGGGARLAQTDKGLSAARISDISYFNYSEDSFYQAIIWKDLEFFDSVADRIADAIKKFNPAQILCDEVEYYNPVHDISLPLVFRALKRIRHDSRVYSIPLVYQAAGAQESYVFQRSLPGKRSDEECFALSPTEGSTKRTAIRDIYIALSAQMQFSPSLIDQACLKEYLVAAQSPLAEVDPSVFLRYDRRGLEAEQSGLVGKAINYDSHYLPLAQSMLS